MTTQLPQRERDTGVERAPDSPDVLFEEARRRRRRRWAAGSALTVAALVAGIALLGAAGGDGGSGQTGGTRVRPEGSGFGGSSAGSNPSRSFPGAPSTQPHSVYPGTACELAPRSRYLPAWSGCVTATVADLTGSDHADLVLIYSRLEPPALHGVPPRSPGKPHRVIYLYAARQAMLRVVTPTRQEITAPIESAAVHGTAYRVSVASLLAIAHVNDQPGREIFLQTGQSSSGSDFAAYNLYRGRLISAGVGFSSGGDSADGNGFDCRPGSPPRVIERNYQLIHGLKAIHQMIYGQWKETITTLVWRGPRLAMSSADTYRRRLLPKERIGAGCTKGI
jgi:hypothetical protein